jgi:hypothetical protein
MTELAANPEAQAITPDLICLLQQGWLISEQQTASRLAAAAARQRLDATLCDIAQLPENIPPLFGPHLAGDLQTICRPDQLQTRLDHLQQVSNQYLGQFVRVKSLAPGSYPIHRYHAGDGENAFRAADHTPSSKIIGITLSRGSLRLLVPGSRLFVQSGDYYVVEALAPLTGGPQVALEFCPCFTDGERSQPKLRRVFGRWADGLRQPASPPAPTN